MQAFGFMLAKVMLFTAAGCAIFAYLMIAMVNPWVLIFLAVPLIVLVPKKAAKLWSHGTAAWATGEEMAEAGLIDADEGLIIGKTQYQPPKLPAIRAILNRKIPAEVSMRMLAQAFRGRKAVVRLPNAIHTAVFAPTGVGKGVSVVIPFLFKCRESVVCIDPKGELYKVTAEERRKLGPVFRLDPFEMFGEGDSLNPLDAIDKESREAIDDCRDLADALVVTTGEEKDPHWNDSARTWLKTIIATVVQYGPHDDRSLQSVRKLLGDPEKSKMAVELACQSQAWGGLLALMGHELTHAQGDELGSVRTSIYRHTEFLDTLAVAKNTKASSFDPAVLRNSVATGYLILPPEHMKAQSALLRMWVSSLLRACVRGGLDETRKVHFVLDEAASLCHMDCIDQAVDQYRGYGVRLLFMWQSVGQLKRNFPNGQDQTLLSNVTQIYFGVNDNQTAEYITKRLGKSTVLVQDTSKNKSRAITYSNNPSVTVTDGTSESLKPHGRELLTPDEVMNLSPRVAITFTPGILPLSTWLSRYYEGPIEEENRGCWGVLKVSFLLLVLGLAAAWVAGDFVQRANRARETITVDW